MQRALVWSLESCSQHIFYSWGNWLVCFHVMGATWEAPSHLALSHFKEALRGKPHFSYNRCWFQARCLRHVCSVCMVLWLGGKQSHRVQRECEKGPTPCLALWTCLFYPRNLAGGSEATQVGPGRLVSRFPLAFQGKHSWVSEQDYSISGVALMAIATWSFISIRISWGADHSCRFPSYQKIWGATPESAFLVTPQASQVARVVKNPPASAGHARVMVSIPGLGRSSGGVKSTSVFVPVKSHRQKKLAGYSPWGHKV